MTADQIAIFVILDGVMGMLIWDKLCYDLVALAALLLSIAVGIVEPAEAFRGFSDDIVIIVGSALAVSALGRVLVAGPGIPPERVGALQKAFTATMNDPELLAEGPPRATPS